MSTIVSSMEFLDKSMGNTPEVQKAIEERKAAIRAEGAVINERTAQGLAAAKENLSREHAERMIPVNAEIAGLKQEALDNRKQTGIDSAFNRLRMGVISRLQMALAREDISDPRAAISTLRAEFDQKLDGVKGEVTEQSISEFETWAVSKAGARYGESVKNEFNNLRERLREQGISLG